jgi:hypothetical protein
MNKERERRPRERRERDAKVSLDGARLLADMNVHPERFRSSHVVNLTKDRSVQETFGVDKDGERVPQSYQIDLTRTTETKAKHALEVIHLSKRSRDRGEAFIESYYEKEQK